MPAIRSQVKKLGLKNSIYFVGYLDRASSLLHCYGAADAFIFASRTETQGLVLLEAMALGVPVVSTAVMGTRDILEPGMGAIVAEEDLEDFCAKAVQILNDEVLRRQLSRQAVEYAQQWTSVEMAGRMANYYRGIINARVPGNNRVSPPASHL